MKRSDLARAACALMTVAAGAAAQITVLNTGSAAPSLFQSTVGNLITIDNTPANVQVGSGAASRAGGTAQQSYIPTGYAVNPPGGWTIQFWLKALSSVTFAYLFGDGSMISPTGTGAFRCYCNGTSSTNSHLIVRGVPVQIQTDASGAGTAPGPLAAGGFGGGPNANGYVHLAVKYDPVTNSGKWIINGTVSGPAYVQGAYAWTGTDLSILGYNGTASAGMAGWWDDFRVYNFARSDADIAADYLLAAAGTGPSSLSNVPQHYFELEGAVDPHVMSIGTTPAGNPLNDPTGTGNRIVTGGTIMEWGSNSPNQPGNSASHILNIFGPSFGMPAINARPLAYRPAPPVPLPYATPGVPGFQLGHGFSVPPNPLAIAWADGLGLASFLPGIVFFAVPGAYQYQVSPNNTFVMPSGLLQDGDSVWLQGIAPDGAYPNGIATTGTAVFLHKNPLTGPHAHVESRGTGAIQVTGFHEVWNTGDTAITQVIIDATTCLANGGSATGFAPSCALNSGGNLGLGTSYRFGTQGLTGLTNLPSGFTGIGLTSTPCVGTAAAVNMYAGLQFDFADFSPTIDHLVFDCDILPSNANGNALIGATVSVTFANATVLSGLMVADPADATAAVIDL